MLASLKREEKNEMQQRPTTEILTLINFFHENGYKNYGVTT